MQFNVYIQVFIFNTKKNHRLKSDETSNYSSAMREMRTKHRNKYIMNGPLLQLLVAFISSITGFKYRLQCHMNPCKKTRDIVPLSPAL